MANFKEIGHGVEYFFVEEFQMLVGFFLPDPQKYLAICAS